MNRVRLMLVAIICVFIATACDQAKGANDGPGADEIGRANLYREPELARFDPAVDVTFVRETGDSLDALLDSLPGETLQDNRWTRLYEQVLGIRIQYKWTAKGDLYYQKLGVAISSGDIPDVVRVNAQQLRQLSNAGSIQDLSEAYDKYAAPFTKEILSQEGSGPFEAATIDGKLMGIPDTSASIEGAQFLWIRTDWLERLGLAPPKTIDDVLAISKAFTERDPDNNGMPDTYGLAVTQHLWDPVMGVGGFMAGYGAYPKMWIEDDGGKLVYGTVQPEVKEALRTLQAMYRNGQIDSEFTFKDGVKAKEQIAAGKIGMAYGEQWGSFVMQASYDQDPEADWQAYPIVSLSGEPPRVPLRFATNMFFAVRAGYEQPEAVVKMFNLHLEKNWGQTAEYETYYSTPYPAWQLSPVTPFPVLKNLEAYRQLEEARRSGNDSALQDEARAILRNIEAYRTRNDSKGWGWARTYGPSGAFAILDGYERNNQLLYEPFVGAPTETMIDKRTILDNLAHDTFVNIILGDPIDDFDRLVEEWNRLGGDRMTAEVNGWYSARELERHN